MPERNPTTSENASTLASLQVLRGVASLLVVMIHVNQTFESKFGTKLLPTFVDAGMIGVDIFFCLSGFIMYFTAQGGFGVPGAWRKFLTRRFLRIYPIYWVVTLLTVLVGLFEPHVLGGHGLNWTTAWKSALLLPQNFSPIVGQGWTLVHEVKFYAIFGLLLLLPRPLALRTAFAWAAVSAVVLGLSYFDTDWLSHTITGRVTNYIFHPGSLEFALGLFAAHVALKWKTHAKVDAAILLGGLATTAVVMQCFYALKPETKYFAITLFMGPSFLLVLGCTLAERRWSPKFPQILVRMGDASYATYLTHILLLEPIVRHLIPEHTSITALRWSAYALVIVLNWSGYLFYRHIEGPLHQRIRAWIASAPPDTGHVKTRH